MQAELARDLLADHEAEIERSLAAMDGAWQRVAAALKMIHDAKLYASYGTWADYCRERWGKQRQWGYQLVEAAKVIENVRERVHDDAPLPQSEWQIRPLTHLPPAGQPAAWQEAVDRFGEPTGEQVATVVRERLAAGAPDDAEAPADDDLDGHTRRFFGEDDDLHLEAVAADPLGFAATVDCIVTHYGEAGVEAVADALDRALPADVPERKPAVYLTSTSDEWYTPPEIAASVRAVLDAIDLDPASTSTANAIIGADRYFDAAQDGLTQPWQGRVFLNPPYSAVAPWIAKLVAEYEAGSITAAIALVAARVDTQWWQALVPYPVCFIRGRLRFSGSTDSAPFPSAVIYLGTNVPRFYEGFHAWGPIYQSLG